MKKGLTGSLGSGAERRIRLVGRLPLHVYADAAMAKPLGAILR